MWSLYPIFLLHMLVFGGVAFAMSYGDRRPDAIFLVAFNGVAIYVYLLFYLGIFGLDQIKWMFINAALGLAGIYTQIGWLLSQFGRNIADYPYYVHIVPTLYFILYTFLIRHLVLDAAGAREDPDRRKRVEAAYVAGSVAIYVASFLSY